MLSRQSARRSSRRPSIPSNFCEPLEPRLALSATVVDGILIIEGSPQADTIVIDPGSTNGSAVLSGVPGVTNLTEFTGVLGLRIDLRSGNDSLSITNSILTPNGQPASLLVLAGNGQDTISLSTTVGTPQVRGGNSHDTLNGGPSNDLLKGGRGIDSLFGNAGQDRLEGQLGRDILVGGPDNDSLFGGNQADELWGNDGEDLLNGGLHRDVLWGGRSTDILIGGPAADRFNGSPDEAQDFGPGDDNYNPLFSTTLSGVLLGPTFWDRAAEGEDTNNGRLEDELKQAMAVLADAFPEVAAQHRQVTSGLLLLSSTQRSQFQSDLLTTTNAFSPPVVADPSALTQQDLEALRDSLIDAAPDAGDFRARFQTYNNNLFGTLAVDGLDARINVLTPDAPSTQGLLFAMDSLFNLTEDF